MAPHRTARNRAAREKVAFLSDGRHLIGRTGTVRMIETHFAWVFLVGKSAFKLKKAMRQHTMDYRSLESREQACRAELRLNRRLAPDVYERLVPLLRDATGHLTFAGRGRVVDWVIKMRRLPSGRMLDRAIVDRRLRPGDLERLMNRLARFFRDAKRYRLTDRSYVRRLRRQVLENAAELRAHDLRLNRRRLDEISQAQLQFIEYGAPVLAGRGVRLVEGHGDLRPEHVYLGSASADACVIDCLEFNVDLCRLDPAEEVALLALECARLGAQHMIERLFGGYRRTLNDGVPDALFEFYLSRRAAVRAQMSAWHLRDPLFRSERRMWMERARQYLDWARYYALRSLKEMVPRSKYSSARSSVEACLSSLPRAQTVTRARVS